MFGVCQLGLSPAMLGFCKFGFGCVKLGLCEFGLRMLRLVYASFGTLCLDSGKFWSRWVMFGLGGSGLGLVVLALVWVMRGSCKCGLG